MINKKNKFLILILLLNAVIFTACDKPLFTELSDSRLKILLKGTYSSNVARDWDGILPGESTMSKPSIEDDSIDDVTADLDTDDIFPSEFYLDIAEIRLTDSEGKDDKISNYRQLYTIKLDGSNQNGEDFFGSGSDSSPDGIELTTDDPIPGKEYKYVKIFFRKMIFNNAKKYEMGSLGWKPASSNLWETIYHEEYITQIFDFNQLQPNSYWDTLRSESQTINRVFPVTIPIYGKDGKGLIYKKENDETVLDIRIVVKNFVKKFEYDYYDVNSVKSAVHYYAFSDWLNDVKPGENSLGGNLHGVATTYVDGESGSLTGSATNGNYVVAIPSGEDIADYQLTSDPTTQRKAVTFKCDLPAPPSGLQVGYSMEDLLDYYLKYEKFRTDWNANYDGCNTVSTSTGWINYETQWNTYNDSIKNFKIPPFVTLSDGSYTITGVPAGTYKVYQISAPSYGILPRTGFSLIGTTHTIP